jgi:hypothetical protein
MVYDTSSKASFQWLHDNYGKIPLPAPLDMKLIRRPSGYECEVSQARAIRLSVYDGVGFPAERYPVIIAGYKAPGNLPREADISDVEKFVQHRPDCTFGGEYSEDSLEEIDAIFLVVIGVMDELRKRGTIPCRQVCTRLLPHGVPI